MRQVLGGVVVLALGCGADPVDPGTPTTWNLESGQGHAVQVHHPDGHFRVTSVDLIHHPEGPQLYGHLATVGGPVVCDAVVEAVFEDEFGEELGRVVVDTYGVRRRRDGETLLDCVGTSAFFHAPADVDPDEVAQMAFELSSTLGDHTPTVAALSPGMVSEWTFRDRHSGQLWGFLVNTGAGDAVLGNHPSRLWVFEVHPDGSETLYSWTTRQHFDEGTIVEPDQALVVVVSDIEVPAPKEGRFTVITDAGWEDVE